MRDCKFSSAAQFKRQSLWSTVWVQTYVCIQGILFVQTCKSEIDKVSACLPLLGLLTLHTTSLFRVPSLSLDDVPFAWFLPVRETIFALNICLPFLQLHFSQHFHKGFRGDVQRSDRNLVLSFSLKEGFFSISSFRLSQRLVGSKKTWSQIDLREIVPIVRTDATSDLNQIQPLLLNLVNLTYLNIPDIV